MKILQENLTGSFGCEVEIDFQNFNPKEFITLLQKKLIVITHLPLADTGLENAKRLYNFINQFGVLNTFQTPEGYMLKPTAMNYKNSKNETIYRGIEKVARSKKPNGKFEGNAAGLANILNWHSDEMATQDAYEYTSLQGIKNSYPSVTQCCQTVDFFSNLDAQTKNWLRTLKVIWDPSKITKNGSLEEMEGRSLDIKWGINDKISPTPIERKVKIKKLIQKNAIGIEGIYFSPSQCPGIEGMSDVEFEEFKKNFIEPILNGSFIYNCEWQDGKFLIMDNKLTLHRRTGKSGNVKELSNKYLETRLLHKAEFNSKVI